jgi:Flp pilus assembly protein TadD
MTETQQNQALRRRGRVRLWLLIGFLAVAGLAAGGAAWWFRGLWQAPPTPPEAKGDQLDPAVVSAVAVVREQVLKNPRSAKAWSDLGEVFLANELEDLSRPCFAEAERLDPTNPRWPYFQAGPLLNRGDYEAALPHLRRAAELCPAGDPAGSAIRLHQAEALLSLGRQDEAAVQIRAARDQRPDDPRAIFDTALVSIAREDWEAARDDLLRCLGSPFSQRRSRVQLAIVCERLGDETQAEEYRVESERLPPDAAWPDPLVDEYIHWTVLKRGRFRRADDLEAAGRFAEAAEIVAPMTVENPDDDLAHIMLGKLLAQMNEYGRAEQELRRALRLAPQKVQAHYYLALLLLKEGEARKPDDPRADVLFREAADLAGQAVAVKPDYGYAHMALGLSLKHLGKRPEAEAALRESLRCNPELAEPHFELGKMLAEDGNGAEARTNLEHAVRLAPMGASWAKEAQDLLARLPSP